jgi:hypothetical protein
MVSSEPSFNPSADEQRRPGHAAASATAVPSPVAVVFRDCPIMMITEMMATIARKTLRLEPDF